MEDALEKEMDEFDLRRQRTRNDIRKELLEHAHYKLGIKGRIVSVMKEIGWKENDTAPFQQSTFSRILMD